jgi:hypothetical protein
MEIVSAKERPDRSSENLLQVMKIMKVGVIHYLSGVVVYEVVMENVEVRESGNGQQKSQRQDVAAEHRASRAG